jgi:hypothetical protein
MMFNDMTKDKHVRGIWNDFLSEHDWQETFAWNPLWPVMPSVAFTFNEQQELIDLSYLTCKKHDGGSTAVYFHPPRAVYNTLPTPQGDQVAPAIVVPRILKPAQAKQYSNSYQMQSMRGHYGGVDSMSLTPHGIFDHISPVTSSNENAAIIGRNDINALARRWTQTNLVMPTWLACTKLKEAKEAYPDMN